VETTEHRARILRAILVAHHCRPNTASSTKLCNLFEKVDVHIEEERQARCECINVEASLQACLDIGKAVAECESELLRCSRPGFTNMVSTDRYGVPSRHLIRAELDHIDDESHRRVGREEPLFLRNVLFENVCLNRAGKLIQANALLF